MGYERLDEGPSHDDDDASQKYHQSNRYQLLDLEKGQRSESECPEEKDVSEERENTRHRLRLVREDIDALMSVPGFIIEDNETTNEDDLCDALWEAIEDHREFDIPKLNDGYADWQRGVYMTQVEAIHRGIRSKFGERRIGTWQPEIVTRKKARVYNQNAVNAIENIRMRYKNFVV